MGEVVAIIVIVLSTALPLLAIRLVEIIGERVYGREKWKR